MDIPLDITAVAIALIAGITTKTMKQITVDREKAVLVHEQLMKFGTTDVTLPGDSKTAYTERPCSICGKGFKTSQVVWHICPDCRKMLISERIQNAQNGP